jgi:isochorismate pyruvate lyase
MNRPEDCQSIEEIRNGIDDIDFRIMQLFHERDAYVREIVKFKTDEVSIVAEKRQKELISKRKVWAKEMGLAPELFEDIFWKIINYNVKKELEILKGQTK